MKNTKPVCVAPTGDGCGEGILWNEDDACVYWTDILRFLVHRYDPRSDSVRSWLFDEPVVGLAPTRRPGVLVVALSSRVVTWDVARDRRLDVLFVLPGTPAVRCNEMRADPHGNLWLGSMRNNVAANGEPIDADGPPLGTLFRIAPDGSVDEQRTGVGISNTLCWSPMQDRMYFGDTRANCIWRYAYDAEGISGERAHFAGHARGLPDGSAIDCEGFLWNCRFGGACVLRVSSDGWVERGVEMPVRNPTTCCFGGEDRRSLYVVSAGLPRAPGERLAGSLFRVDCGIEGLPAHRFAFG